MSGDAARTRRDELGDRLDAVHGSRRIVGIVEEYQPRAFGRRGHRIEVETHGRIDLDLDDRMAEFLRHAWTVFKSRRGGHQCASRRRECTNGALEDFLRSSAEHDVLRFGVELRGDGRDQRAVGRRAVERVASGLGELADDRIERGLAGPERILVAADTDWLDARRQLRPGRLSTLSGLRLILLVAAGRDPERGVPSIRGPRRSVLPTEPRENPGASDACDPPPSAAVWAWILRLGPEAVKPSAHQRRVGIALKARYFSTSGLVVAGDDGEAQACLTPAAEEMSVAPRSIQSKPTPMMRRFAGDAGGLDGWPPLCVTVTVWPATVSVPARATVVAPTL